MVTLPMIAMLYKARLIAINSHSVILPAPACRGSDARATSGARAESTCPGVPWKDLEIFSFTMLIWGILTSLGRIFRVPGEDVRCGRSELGQWAKSPLDVRVSLAAGTPTQRRASEVLCCLLVKMFRRRFGVFRRCFGLFCEIANKDAVCFG